MGVSAADVKKLREITGLGMMNCKKALIDSDGDMDKAIDGLRKQGQATAAKRAGKNAKEGKIFIINSGDDSLIYEVNAETDFVAKNKDFNEFAEEIGNVIIAEKPDGIDELLSLKVESFGNKSVEERLMELVGKIGEKITISRFGVLSAGSKNEKTFSYLHNNNKVGAIVLFSSDKPETLSSDTAERLGKDIAMQVTAANPMSVMRDGVPEDIVSSERDIFSTQAKNSGKPENILEKIVEGKMNKFYKENVLLEQQYIKDQDINVQKRIGETEKETGSPISVKAFVRYEIGS